jgi:sugar O-acyltransferase (sialic acid O-acetyltransferase NeuD family)
MHEVVLVGAGGFAREVCHWAQAALPRDEYRIGGFLSNNPKDLDGFQLPGLRGSSPVLGDPERYEVQDEERFVLAVGTIDTKVKLVTHLKAQGARFLTIIHPTAIVAPTARIGEGVVICPFVTVSDSVTIGDFAMLNFYASCGHDATIGACSVLSPYATLNGYATLADQVFVGTHATVTA